MDTRVGEVQLADVAVIGDDIDVELVVCLFQEGVDDGRKEICLLVGGDEDTEGIIPFRQDGRSMRWPNTDQPPERMDHQQEERLDKPGGQ